MTGKCPFCDVDAARILVEREVGFALPDAFNIGVNDGRAAGQTVMHAHIHVIPRYAGETFNMREWRRQERT